ncbi:Exocyst complex component [Seminavis robusta]|uniref:Exocyst complex component n=1 Tax=Seminavis robusta TaxID=568900 RepID=A0A9N8E108_9STRA|nr:Exocyst complex component [Seminavis robusta]|eukprot:Sro400_g135190.1 Exocyst complex component (786) ;mRNA; r:54038-56794
MAEKSTSKPIAVLVTREAFTFRSIEEASDQLQKIPDISSNLKSQVDATEWSNDEWTALRDGCRQHAVLEIFLLEVGTALDQQTSKDEVVAALLSKQIEIVKDLADEFRMKILSGFSCLVELATDAPKGRDALIETVTIGESLAAQVGLPEAEADPFGHIRADALDTLARVIAERISEKFRNATESVALLGDNEFSSVMDAVLQTANEVLSEIKIMAKDVVAGMPSEWEFGPVLICLVAEECSTGMLQQITSEHTYVELSEAHLLGLVAWVEKWKLTVQEIFPELSSLVGSKRANFDNRPMLRSSDGKLDIGMAKEALKYANNLLWDVHNMALTEFVFRTKEEIAELLDRCYRAEHQKLEPSDGLLTSSLDMDIYGFIGVPVKKIQEALPPKTNAIPQCLGVILKCLFDAQKTHLNMILTDFESCCARVNDFSQMNRKCETLVNEIRGLVAPESLEALKKQEECVRERYTADAVYAAQKTSYFIFNDIYECGDITGSLFNEVWLQDTGNGIAEQIVITMNDYYGDLKGYLDDKMVIRALEALIKKCYVYYVEQLLARSSVHKSTNESFFADNKKALNRLKDDIGVIKEFFEEIASEKEEPELKAVIALEFKVLETIHEVMSIAAGAGVSHDDIKPCIRALHDSLGKYATVRTIVSGLYRLVNPAELEAATKKLDEEEKDLKTNDSKEDIEVIAHESVPGQNLDVLVLLPSYKPPLAKVDSSVSSPTKPQPNGSQQAKSLLPLELQQELAARGIGGSNTTIISELLKRLKAAEEHLRQKNPRPDDQL